MTISIGLSRSAFFHLLTHALFHPDLLADSQHNLYDKYLLLCVQY